MKTRLPVIITFAVGSFMLLEMFFEGAQVKRVKDFITDFGMVLLAFAYLPMLVDVAAREIKKIRTKHEDSMYSLALLFGAGIMLGFGLIGGIKNPVFLWVYHYLYGPLQSTMFSLLAFFIASAAFRAFRARSLEAGILLGAAILVMIGRVPLGEWVWSGFVDIESWIMNTPNLAAKRAIMIGAAIGAITTAMRVILGLERDFLGGDE